MRALITSMIVAPLVLGSLPAFAQSNPSASQIINSLKPSGNLMQGGTRGIRLAAPTNDGAPTPAPAPAQQPRVAATKPVPVPVTAATPSACWMPHVPAAWRLVSPRPGMVTAAHHQWGRPVGCHVSHP